MTLQIERRALEDPLFWSFPVSLRGPPSRTTHFACAALINLGELYASGALGAKDNRAALAAYESAFLLGNDRVS